MKAGVVCAVLDDGLSSKIQPFGTIRALSMASAPLVGRLGMGRVRHDLAGRPKFGRGFVGRVDSGLS